MKIKMASTGLQKPIFKVWRHPYECLDIAKSNRGLESLQLVRQGLMPRNELLVAQCQELFVGGRGLLAVGVGKGLYP